MVMKRFISPAGFISFSFGKRYGFIEIVEVILVKHYPYTVKFQLPLPFQSDSNLFCLFDSAIVFLLLKNYIRLAI